MNGFQVVSRAEVLRWVAQLVAHPSEQTLALERDTAVQELGPTCVAPIIERFGLRARYDEFGNMLVEAGPTHDAPSLVFFAYAMTHPRAAMTEPFTCIELLTEGGPCLRGRGISEQKAALAASLAAFIDVIASSPLNSRVVWVLLTAGETGRHDAIERVLSAIGAIPRRAVLAIGTSLHIETGHRGRLDVNVLIEGRAAHSSTPWLGADVTDAVESTLARVRRISASLDRHAALGPASLTCTSIHTGPVATHTVQSEARMTFDRRLLPHESVDEVFSGLERDLQLAPPFKVTVARGAHMHPHLLPHDSVFVGDILAAIREAGLMRPTMGYAHGALDAGLLQRRGCEAVMWGPGDPRQFHTNDECIRVDEIMQAAQYYRAVVRHITSKDA